jgi:hypothetical protein
MTMPRVLPLDVPWQISPSVSFLGFTSKYFEGMNHGYVTFEGFLGESTQLSQRHGQYKQVLVVLQNVVWAKLYPEFSDEDAERLNSYDWSQVPEFRDEAGSLKGHASRFHEQWISTGRCPEPAAYTLGESDVLRLLGFQQDSFKHYLFVGDDFSVEVIAQSMTWHFVDSPSASESGTG